MKPETRDVSILERIIAYCDEIDSTKEYFGDSKEILRTNSIYKNALSMCVLQIGELTTHLTTNFRSTHTSVPWSDIKKMRDIAAHHYGAFSVDFLWDTVTDDITVLRSYCRACIEELRTSDAHAISRRPPRKSPDTTG
ncbi:MAG: DUF86 domain-containing protein [Coriobacteriales bacterium]|jgi:uncharacterized protein with HEPN domain|nr:DUF86 domain-containing protein [Coriobacteriales bacterium]